MMPSGADCGVTMGGRPGRSTTDELLSEAAGLAEAVRDLLLVAGTSRPAGVAASVARLRRAAKVGELATLLGYAVAWLLTRKAVETGELTAAEGSAPSRRLATLAPVMLPPSAADDRLGRRLAELDGRVRALHSRLARLDRLLDREDGGAADSR